MAYQINSYNDFVNFVQTTFQTRRVEINGICKLQYDFMYSMPQKIEAAKNSLQGSEHKGTLRLLEEAEKQMLSAYQQYAERVPEYWAVTHGAAILQEAISNNSIKVSLPVVNQIYNKCHQLGEAHKKYGMGVVNAYGVVNSIVDGKGAQTSVIDDMKKYGFYDEYTTRGYTTEKLDNKLSRNAGQQRFQIINNIHKAIIASDEQHSLYYDSLPLAESQWQFKLMEDHQPVKLSPNKAVLHLDKLEMSTGSLDLNNYGEFIESNKAVAQEWANKCFDNMFDGIYNASELEQMQQDGISPLDGVFIDGKPLNELYGDVPYEQRALKAAQTILDGDHSLVVCRQEKQENGSYITGKALKGEVRTELEEHLSLWRRFLIWLGIEKTKSSRISASGLELEETVAQINSERLPSIIEKQDAAIINADRVFFKDNAPAEVQDVDSYFQALTMYFDSVKDGKETDQHHILKTFYRPATRGHIAVLYMMSSGMSLDEALSAAPSLDERKKALGREFIDTITVLSRDKYAEKNGKTAGNEEFEAEYTAYRKQKETDIVKLYNEKLIPAQQRLAGMIPELSANDISQFTENYPTIEMCVYGALDLVQSLNEYPKNNPQDTLTNSNINRCSKDKCYSLVIDHFKARSAALSQAGMSDPKTAFIALIQKAGAEQFTNALKGKSQEEALAIKAEYTHISDMVRVSALSKAGTFDNEALQAIHKEMLDKVKSRESVPEMFSDFITNIKEERCDNYGIAIFPVSNREFAEQFSNSKASSKSAPTKSK